jgi:high-affinity Fe2+/Pb2+ permease
MTFRSEDEHAQLKRHLKSSIEDLKIVIDNIKLLLINQIHDHTIALDDAKSRYSAHLRKSIFQQLFAFVALNVINLMMSEYELLTNQTTALSRCIEIFTKIMKLSCSHKMQKRLYEKRSLLIEDVHSH